MADGPEVQTEAIGEEEERLTNLYVASWNLHSSLDLREVVTVILEICLNLIGADRTVFYVYDEESKRLEPVTAHGMEGLPATGVVLGEGPVGEAVESGRAWTNPNADAGPLAVVPLTASGRPVGAVVVDRLLQQKPSLSPLDLEIFDLLGRQGGLALYGAFLAGATPRKITATEFRHRLEAEDG